MTTVAEITGAIRRLPKRELAKFRRWFTEFDAAAWDPEFEETSQMAGWTRWPARHCETTAPAGLPNCETSGHAAVLAQIADRGYELLKNNPAHPSLHFKKVGKFWSASNAFHRQRRLQAV